MKGVMKMAIDDRVRLALKTVDLFVPSVLNWAKPCVEYERAALISALELLLDEARASANREDVEQDG